MSVLFLNLEEQMCLFGIGEGGDRSDARVNALPEFKKGAPSDLMRISLPRFLVPPHWALGSNQKMAHQENLTGSWRLKLSMSIVANRRECLGSIQDERPVQHSPMAILEDCMHATLALKGSPSKLYEGATT